MGPAHGGVEFLKGSFSGTEKLWPAGSARAGVKELMSTTKIISQDRRSFQRQCIEIEQNQQIHCSAVRIIINFGISSTKFHGKLGLRSVWRT